MVGGSQAASSAGYRMSAFDAVDGSSTGT